MLDVQHTSKSAEPGIPSAVNFSIVEYRPHVNEPRIVYWGTVNEPRIDNIIFLEIE